MNGRWNLNRSRDDQDEPNPTAWEPSFVDDADARLASGGVGRRRPDAIPDIDAPLHVAPSDDGWRVSFEGHDAAAGVWSTKKAAMAAARELAEARGLRIVEHGRDGRIRS